MAGGNVVASAFVQIIPTMQGAQATISKELGSAGTSAGTVAGGKFGTSMAQTVGSKMKVVGAGIAKAGAVMSAVGLLGVAAGKKFMDMAQIQANAETKLKEIYKSRMGVTEEAAQATIDYAGALQKQGVVGDEVTLSGAQQLATFAKYPATVNKLLPAMDNLLVQQKGLNATSEDATSVANLMGKVMQGQTGALKRVGISFTAAQEKVLKYGTEEEKAAMLAEVITDNVGEMNKTFAETDAGKIQQAKNTLGDMGERIGAVLIPAVADIAQWISANLMPKVEQLISFFESHPMVAKVVAGIVAIMAVGGPLLVMIGSVISAIGAILPVLSALFSPIGLIIAAIAAVIAIGVLLYKHWDEVKAKAKAIWSAIKATIAGIIDGIKAKVTAVFNAIKAVVSNVWNGIKSTISSIINGIKSTISNVFNAIKGTVSRVFSGIKSVASNAWNGIKNAIIQPIEAARDKVKGILDRIKGIFPLHLGKIFDSIKLPHISVSGGKAPFGIAGKGSLPKFQVTWAAKGGIVDGATLIGAGEAGSEAIVPLDPFWNRLDAAMAGGIDYELMAAALVNALSRAEIINELVVDGRVVARATAPYMKTETEKLDRRANRKLGYA